MKRDSARIGKMSAGNGLYEYIKKPEHPFATKAVKGIGFEFFVPE